MRLIPGPIKRPVYLLLTALAGIAALLALLSGQDRRSHLEEVLERGSLTLLSRYGATSYYLGPEGYTGFEYDLAAGFADYLGVQLQVTVPDQFQQIFPALDAGAGDLIAANITRTPQREKRYRFGPDYQLVRAEVVYRSGSKRPRTVAELLGNRIRVIAGSSYVDLLREARQEIPQLQWQESDEASIEDLLDAVSKGVIDYTVIDSTAFKINQRYFPRVRRAFSLGPELPMAWVFPADRDNSLMFEARNFFSQIEQNGDLAALNSAYYGEPGDFDQIGMLTFVQKIEQRLPKLLPLFNQIAADHDLDWRLLAAMGYQESHWNPEAVSRTGVRGIMMLTQRTADQLGIADRLDPIQSIEGGARYLKRLLRRVPERIDSDNRLWLALAAYNIGWGHLEDARVLTQRNGGDPDQWPDVRKHLLLLTQEKWFRQTRHGYARGYEAAHYVDNIRSYYDTLIWMETHSHPLMSEIKVSTST